MRSLFKDGFTRKYSLRLCNSHVIKRVSLKLQRSVYKSYIPSKKKTVFAQLKLVLYSI